MVSATFIVYMTAALWAQLPSLSCLGPKRAGRGMRQLAHRPQTRNSDENNDITPYELEKAETSCRETPNEACVMLCFYKKIGIIKDEEYVEDKMEEFIAKVVIYYLLPDAFENDLKNKLADIPYLCRADINKKQLTGCDLGNEVDKCYHEEMNKIYNEKVKKLNEIREQCEEEEDECVGRCILEAYGVLSKEDEKPQDWYDEEEMKKFIGLRLMHLIIGYDIYYDEDEVNNIAKKCIDDTKRITEKCYRAEEVFICLSLEPDKVYFSKPLKLW